MSEPARDTGATWLDSQADAAQGIIGTLPPRPLPDSRPPVEPFRADMLPEAIRAYVMDVADRQQSPPDFVAVASICGLSAVLGRKVLIRPKQHDDWTVTPNQWGAIIGRPSAMKSPSMKEALRPLDKIQRDAREAFEFALEEHAAENRLREIEKGEIEKQAKKLAREKKREEALALLVQSEAEGEAPTRLRLVVNDASVEKLGELLNENPNGLILVRDELAGWLSKMTQDDHQADRAFYLECFDGNGRFTYDRIGRGTIDIEHCTLSMIGGIQPSKIAPLVRGATRGTADDGLIQRLQLAVWPDDNRRWRWIDRQPDAKARHAFEQAFYRLHGLHFDDGTGEPPCWRFTAKAQGLFVEWMEEVQKIARADDIHPALESHLLKMPQTIAGLALLFEVLDGQGGEVGEIATARALEWADYLRSHAERLYSVAVGSAIESARLILSRREKLPELFTGRDIQRKGWAGLDSLEAIRDALETLVEYGYLTESLMPPTAQGGRPSTRYHWNPLLQRGEV